MGQTADDAMWKMINLLKMPRWNDVLLELSRSKNSARYCERISRAVKASRTHVREVVKVLVDHKAATILQSDSFLAALSYCVTYPSD